MDGSLDWAGEWFTSAVWIVKVFSATVVGGLLAGWAVTRYSTWGRQFRRLGLAFFRPGKDRRSWTPVVIALALLVLTVGAVRLNVLLSYSTNGLYTALQDLNSSAFARYLAIFGVLASVHVVRSLVDYLVSQTLVIRWRMWVNDQVLTDWLAGRAYHRGRFAPDAVDNPDQRIQEDVESFVSTSVGLATGLLSSLISLGSFSVILWSLSGPLTLAGITIPRAMIFIAYLYVIAASVVAFRVGHPLIRLNFLNERLNASFRYALVRLRDTSEQVAFCQGEDVERATLQSRFSAVIANYWARVFQTLKFQGFNLVISQGSVVVPIVMQAPRFFSGAITLGDVQQTATAFGQVHDALSFFRTSYDTFAGYRATLNRLTGLLDADDQARALPSPEVVEDLRVRVRDLTVRRPDTRPLLEHLDLDLDPGDALLVVGPSGSGKTTLLRALADLWPYTDGTIHRPTGTNALFLPQQPYLPLGSLRAVLAYPRARDTLADSLARQTLEHVHLGHLAHHLDEDTDWAHQLSPGEQQRLGFARVLIHRPRVIFLDEATSALDEGIEYALYELLRRELPQSILVSVGHRSSLTALHTRRLQLQGTGHWGVSLTVPGSRGAPEGARSPERVRPDAGLTPDGTVRQFEGGAGAGTS